MPKYTLQLQVQRMKLYILYINSFHNKTNSCFALCAMCVCKCKNERSKKEKMLHSWMIKANTNKLDRLTTAKSLLIRYINTVGFDGKWTKFLSSCEWKYLIEFKWIWEDRHSQWIYRNHFEICNNNENPVTISSFSFPIIMIQCHFSFWGQREWAFEYELNTR